jgi:hypothetical protein
VPFLVLLTDLADLPPHFWIEPGVDGVIVGTLEAARQARELGLGEEHIHRVSGMPLHPRFYSAGESAEALRARVRAELGIPEAAFTAMLLFGGRARRRSSPHAELRRRSRPARGGVVRRQPHLLEASPAGRLRRRLHPIGFTIASPTTWR